MGQEWGARVSAAGVGPTLALSATGCTSVSLWPFSGCTGTTACCAGSGLEGRRPEQGREGGGTSSKFKFQLPEE